MPFGWVSPSIGLGLLSAHLKRDGIECDVHYPNLRYAARIGFDLYQRISHIAPPQSLLGEWIFAPCLSDDSSQPEYLALYRQRFSDRLAAVDCAGLADEALRLRYDSAAFLEEVYASIDWRDYDVVGFTSSFHQTLPSVALASLIKARTPWIRTVMGGANCEGPMGVALHRAFPQIDFVCSGEADISFPRLIRALMQNDDLDASRIPGVIARVDGQSRFASLTPERVPDLDTLPFPDYDSYFAELAALPALPQTRHLLLETSRGCWWGAKQQCTFCGLNGLAMPFRSKSASRALDEIETLTARHATKRIEMVDNILDMRYFQTLLPELKRRDLDLDLFYETKANLKQEQVKLLADAGVRRIQPGIESFSNRVLQLMKKGSTAAQNLQLLEWCKEYGIQCDWNLLYGFPGETAADYADLPALLAQLHHLDPPVAAGAIRMDRFSPYFEEPAAHGLSNVRPDAFYRLVFPVGGDTLPDLAYYFDFDYPAGHDHRTYASAIHDSVETSRAARSGGMSRKLALKLAALSASATTGEQRVLQSILAAGEKS